jgi:hypothetical protein
VEVTKGPSQQLVAKGTGQDRIRRYGYSQRLLR